MQRVKLLEPIFNKFTSGRCTHGVHFENNRKVLIIVTDCMIITKTNLHSFKTVHGHGHYNQPEDRNNDDRDLELL